MIAFTIPGQPYGKGRARSSALYGRDGKPVLKDGRVIVTHHTPEKTVSYEGLIAHIAHRAMERRPPWTCAMGMNLFIALQVPASWSQKKQRMALAGEIFPTTKPDTDNVVKAICDGLNGIVWKDDVQWCQGILVKRYADTPRVSVEVWPLEAAVQDELPIAQEPTIKAAPILTMR